MFRNGTKQAIALSAALAISAVPAWCQSNMPKAEQGYTLSVFAKSPAGQTKPDSIAVFDSHIYIAYGNGNAPDGTDGKNNRIVEYNRSGQAVYSFVVKGHNDGLKVDPYTEKLWVLQNEDSNPNLVVFDPETREQKLYTIRAAAGERRWIRRHRVSERQGLHKRLESGFGGERCAGDCRGHA